MLYLFSRYAFGLKPGAVTSVLLCSSSFSKAKELIVEKFNTDPESFRLIDLGESDKEMKKESIVAVIRKSEEAD